MGASRTFLALRALPPGHESANVAPQAAQGSAVSLLVSRPENDLDIAECGPRKAGKLPIKRHVGQIHMCLAKLPVTSLSRSSLGKGPEDKQVWAVRRQGAGNHRELPRVIG